MMNNGMVRNVSMEKQEPKEVDKIEDVKQLETVNLSSESMVEIAKMVSSMLETSTSTDVKHLHEKLHEIDKRVAILEKMFDYIKSVK